MSEDDNLRILPQNNLDFNLMLTDTLWGKEEIPKELRDKLDKYFINQAEDGKQFIDKASLWGLLGFYTRDMRLGNLSSFDNELQTCRYMIDLANDLLNSDMIEPFLISLSRSATILETSQSKVGFLRKIMNTLIKQESTQQLEPPKKSMFGGSKNNNGGY